MLAHREVKIRLTIFYSVSCTKCAQGINFLFFLMKGFITPHLFLFFTQNPEDSLELQTQPLNLKNVSGLPLSIALTLKYPFQLLLDDGSESSDMVRAIF